ncbi:unnamed protein product [Thelazia callipaeda]|uniref:RING-type domain-containing protein n=1 Tax=Thelazia callipaeda TaxID=103827 RepID=A0A0N5CUJ1_THECL|nr:unnamed protein product [Thelazia callipaeda]
MVDDFLMEAMICPICRMVFQAPEQLQCGHSFCSTCIGRLCQAFVFSDRFPTCPLCRMRITEKPVSNYTLSSLISRLKEKESMSKKCVQCSKMLTSEEQFSCDDCDHADREENVRCTLCIIEKHAKIGHSISKYGDTKQLINSAQEELKVILKKTTQFLEDCRRVTRERFDVINELFKLLSAHCSEFKLLEQSLQEGNFQSKKTIGLKLEHARRLHEFYRKFRFLIFMSCIC